MNYLILEKTKKGATTMKTETKKFHSAFRMRSRLFSMCLVFAMVLTLLQSLPAGVLAVQAATDSTTLTTSIGLGDSVQLQIDGSTTMDLTARGNGAFGEAVNLSAEAHTVKVLINEEVAAEKTITPENACAVGIWVENGVLYDTVNNSDKVPETTVPALVGTIGVSLKDAAGSTVTVDWTLDSAASKFVYIGNGIYARTFLMDALEAEGTVEYKVSVGTSWDTAIGNGGAGSNYGNITSTIPVGATEWTVYADTNSNKAWDSYNVGAIPYLRGTMNGWVADADGAFSRLNGTLYYLEQSITASDYTYKVDVGGTWAEPYPNSDKSLSAAEDGTVYFLFDYGAYTVYDSASEKDTIINKLGLTTPFTSPEVTDSGVTFRYYSASAETVALIGSMNNWDQTNTIAMTKETDNIWTTTQTLAPGKYTYKFLVDGTGWITDPKNSNVEGNDNNSVVIVPGLTGTAITVGKGVEKELPATLDYMNADGSTTAKTVSYALEESIEGVTLDTENNKIKVATTYVGTTLTLTATTTDEDALTATVTVNLVEAEDYVVSPDVNGKKVTFRYLDENGNMKNVSIAGTVTDDWAIVDMTKDEETNIWSWTTELEPGEYEYKFIADDGVEGNNDWITDPMNDDVAVSGNSWFRLTGYMGTTIDVPAGETFALPLSFHKLESDGTSSAVTVADYLDADEESVGMAITATEEQIGTEITLTAKTEDEEAFPVKLLVKEDTGKITVNVHYNRTNAADYEAWIWSDTKGGAFYDFAKTDANGNGVATFVIDDPHYDNKVTVEIRIDDDWNIKDGGGKRYIDISDVLSGTVDFYTSQDASGGNRVLADDTLTGAKVKKVEYNRDTNKMVVTTAKPIYGDISNVFTLTRVSDSKNLTIEGITVAQVDGVYTYTIDIAEDLTSTEAVLKSYVMNFGGFTYSVTMPNIYSSSEFEDVYTYDGDDLGATYAPESTTFKVWAPTADKVELNLYATGSDEEEGAANLGTFAMEKQKTVVEGEETFQGVWIKTVEGDLKNVYYTYSVSVDGRVNEACDPYARATGVNGKRAMVVDLDSTDPEGWEEDYRPHTDMDYTDAVIYELHVRDMSIDESSGISESNKGKYLAFTEEGTTVDADGDGVGDGEISTGIDHLTELGVTHVHMLPIYDYGSVDETKLDEAQFNWGYDPVNYNVPEGSYSSNPYDGNVRVNEMKQMVQSLHDNNINVIMDVVYNHVYDAGNFCFNQIVPYYFSRTNADGSYSDGSGCGNDTASERNMVRKYIVDSVLYWAEEYHIDGFRFDLVGLLDTETINAVVDAVHEVDPDIIFYGEGWEMGTATSKDVSMTKQGNSSMVPKFAFFSDTIRDLLKGKNDETSPGYINGLKGQEEAIANSFMGKPWWTDNPSQVVNYASCHDNYTLKDKINVTTSTYTEEQRIKMNNLAAAIYLTAEGIPLIHAGEEMLRTKVDEDGNVIHNSYNSSDYVNSLKWDNLTNEDYKEVSDYYAGLIEFRKNHAGLRLSTAEAVASYVDYIWLTNEVVMFAIDGDATDESGNFVEEEVSDGILVIFNANTTSKTFDLTGNGISGDWTVCINGENAGNTSLGTMSASSVSVDALSALVLVQGELEDTDSVYVKNTKTIPVEQITLSADTLTLDENAETTLTATITPENATNKKVTWKSSDETVATVDENGKVTAIKAGETTITVTATDGSGVSKSCKVTVTSKEEDPDPEPEPEEIKVTGIALSKENVSLEVAGTEKLTATITPENATNKKVTWKSSDETVAIVDETGKVTAIAAGDATITVTAQDGSGISVNCKVTVTSKDEGGSGEEGGSEAEKYTGLKKIDGIWYYVVDDEINTEYTGLVKKDGAWFYVEKGKLNWNYTGLVKKDGIWFYVEKGILNWNYTGLVKKDGTWFYVEKGKLNWKYTGLVKKDADWYYVEKGILNWKFTDVVKKDGAWFYVKGGIWAKNYTGLCKFDSTWYHVNKGVLDWNYTGLSSYKDGWYYVEDGVINRDYTGLCKYNGKWFYVGKGVLDWKYTGLVKHNGQWFYVQASQLTWKKTGLVKHNGQWFYVENSQLNWKYTGLAKNAGKWFYVEKGVLNWKYTGLAKNAGQWFYVEKGEVNWKYTGLVKNAGKWFYVEKGVLNWKYTGLATRENTWYYVEKGVVNFNYTGKITYAGVKWTIKNGVMTGRV